MLPLLLRICIEPKARGYEQEEERGGDEAFHSVSGTFYSRAEYKPPASQNKGFHGLSDLSLRVCRELSHKLDVTAPMLYKRNLDGRF